MLLVDKLLALVAIVASSSAVSLTAANLPWLPRWVVIVLQVIATVAGLLARLHPAEPPVTVTPAIAPPQHPPRE